MKRRTLLIALLALALVIALAGVATAQDDAPGSIGRAMWRMKCHSEASVQIETLPDGTSLVTCFLYW